MLPIQTILHPTDYSKRSQYAFRLSCSLARDYGARLFLLHVIPPPLLKGGGDPVACTIIEEFFSQQRQKLDQLQVPDPSVEVVRQLVQGDPATEILRVAQEISCDMIIMGSHGWAGLKRLLVGSVAEGVARQALCPVVIVKTPFLQAESTYGSSVGESQDVQERALERRLCGTR